MCLGPYFTQAAVSQAPALTYGCSVKEAPAVVFAPFVFDTSFSAKCGEAASADDPNSKLVPHADVDEQLLGKTKLCKFFARGHCSRGKACTFAHGRRELRSQPNLFKTEMCFEFSSSGTCQRGESCQYAHGEHELRAVTVLPAATAPSPQRKVAETTRLNQKLAEIEREAED